VTVTAVDAVTEPAELVAVSVYVVVAAGLTLVEPLAALEVNDPGAIAMVVAPLVAQLSCVLAPAAIVAGVAWNEVTVGFDGGGVLATVTVAVAVTEPVALLAVSV
jgi:hypothetical protein